MRDRGVGAARMGPWGGRWVLGRVRGLCARRGPGLASAGGTDPVGRLVGRGAAGRFVGPGTGPAEAAPVPVRPLTPETAVPPSVPMAPDISCRYANPDGRRAALSYSCQPGGRHVVRYDDPDGERLKWAYDDVAGARERWRMLVLRLEVSGFVRTE